jgi:hypothetical protein
MRPTLVGWSPEVALSSTGKTDEKQLMRRLAEAAQESSATRFAFSPGDHVEPLDGNGRV